MAAIISRVTRSSMLEVLRTDYVNLARAKGLPEWKVIVKHALRNGLIPTVTVIGLEIGVLLGGNMIVETVFGGLVWDAWLLMLFLAGITPWCRGLLCFMLLPLSWLIYWLIFYIPILIQR